MPYEAVKRSLYNTWYQMVARCEDSSHPAFKDYGARGITVCPPWRTSFEVFLKDVGPRPSPKHTLDRIDNDEGYYPDNVKWSTMKEQSNNRRSNKLIHYNGKTQTAAQWAEELFPDNPKRIQTRLAKGWSVERALQETIREKTPSALNDRIEWNGESCTVREWGERLFPGDLKILPMRLNAGWSVERALTQPKRRNSSCD